MKIGHHTPTLTKMILKIMNRDTKLDWSCNSWQHDTRDCVYHLIDNNESILDEEIVIYIPKEDENGFIVMDEEREVLYVSHKITDVVKFIKENY